MPLVGIEAPISPPLPVIALVIPTVDAAYIKVVPAPVKNPP